MADVTESLVDEREELMVPPNGGKPTLRNAHFLKPTFAFSSTQDHHLLPPSPLSISLLSSTPKLHEHERYRLESYKAYPSQKWKTWVHILEPEYREIWRKAGIYEAILASTYKIPNDKKLVIGLAERWCDQTNTFIFPWGEVTITLEDIINLGSYSVLGVSVLTPVPDELVDVFDCMKKVLNKATLSNRRTANKWMEHFMCSGKKLEHVAFLAFWLAKFVLLRSNDYISIEHLQVAIHLSQGTKVALAPVVLASIYRDMRLLSKSTLEFGKLRRILVTHTNLLQMWAWERFPEISPVPNVMKRGEPRSARWNGLKTLVVKDLRAAFDSAEKSFLWRPYAIFSNNCMFSEVYTDNEQWVVVDSNETESFARCLRVSEIVGVGSTEQYHPNRVARQFGLDQDLPPRVNRSNESSETAWCRYIRSIRGVKLYIPPRLFLSHVSSRYLDWWRGLVTVINEDATRVPLTSSGPMNDSISLDTPVCASKCPEERSHDNTEDLGSTIAQLLSRSRKIGSCKTRREADNEQVLAVCSGSPTKRLCMTEPEELRNSSSENCEKSKSSTGKQIEPEANAFVNKVNYPEVNIVNSEEANIIDTQILRLEEVNIVDTEKQMEQAENAVVSRGNYQEVNVVNAKEENRGSGTCEVPQLELETHILRPKEVNIVDTEEERCIKTTSEAPKLDLKTRILRLEMIVDMIKTAKLASSSRDIQ